MARTEQEWEARPALHERDYVDSRIYTDPDIFRDEREFVFRKTWKFICHESEIPVPCDYRTFEYAGYPLIVARDIDGQIRAFINSCSHRSALVLREAAGNAKSWTCLFHNWVYDTSGRCISIPREEGYEEAGICKADQGLREVRVETRHDLVFVNLDTSAISFDDYLGDALESLTSIFATGELEVFHLHRAVVDANWKQWHEVSTELYHEYLHYLNRRVGIRTEGYFDTPWHFYPHGHASLEPMRQSYQNIGSSGQRDNTLPGLHPGETRVVGLFPNTVFVCRATVMMIHTTNALSAEKTLVEWRGLGVKGESVQDRAMRIEHHNEFWGPFGRNVPEDVIAVECVARANREGAARYGLFGRHEGHATQDDESVRVFYDEWSQLVGRRANDPKAETQTKAP